MLENTFQHISLTTEWGMVNGFNGISNDNAYQSITLMVFLSVLSEEEMNQIKNRTEFTSHHDFFQAIF